jgi:hypothetical protein
LAGRTLSFDDYCDEILHPENRYVRYRDTIVPWDRTFGRENMHVLSVAPGTNVVDMLCQALIPQVAWNRTEMSYWENKSLGASATEALRHVNMALPAAESRRDDLAGRLKWLMLHLARYRIRGLIAAVAGDRPRDRFRMSDHNHGRLQEVADVDRQWLAANYNLRLDALGADGEPPPDDEFAKSLAAQVKARPWVKLLMAMR